MKWPTVRLEHLAVPEKGAIKIGPFGSQLKKEELTSTGIHVVGIENVIRGQFDGLGDRYISESKFQELSSVEIKPGDILITMMGTIGEVAIVPKDNNISIMDSHLLRFRPNLDLCIPEYIKYLIIGGAETRAVLHGRAHGAIMKGLNSSIIRSLPVPLPTLSEQRRIVELLDQADALKKKRSKANAKTVRILPALFYRIFGDPATNPKAWAIRPLSDLGAQVRYGLGQPPKASETGVALVRATNISRGTISSVNMTYVDPMDVPPGKNAFLKAEEVIVVRSGAYTGDIAQVTKDWEGCVAGYDLVITPGESLVGEFIESYLLTTFIQKGYFQNLKARAGQPHLNADQVSATPFLDVPYGLQKKFSECVQYHRALKQKIAIVGQEIESIFAVILHRAFTGDLTAKWREAHMKELLQEMANQAKVLE